MKKVLLFGLLALLISLPVVAYDFRSGGIYYNIGDNNTVSVTFGDQKYTGGVSIPNEVTYNGVKLRVTSIGDNAFYNCQQLTSVTIPNSVTSIRGRAFYLCGSLTSITIPNRVTSIGDNAFFGCHGLTSITIPNSVTSIEDYAFYYCTHLSFVYSQIQTPFYIEKYVFDFISSNATLQVPKGTKSKYESFQYWTDNFKEIVEAEGGNNSYELSIKATGNGSASYNGTTIRSKTSTFTVNEGTNAVITFTPDNGYQIKSIKVGPTDDTASVLTIGINGNWFVDGVDTGVSSQMTGGAPAIKIGGNGNWFADGKYTISSISENTIVEVEFEIVNVSSVVDINGIRYNLNHSEKTAEVTSKGDKSYEGDIVIPESIYINGDIYNVTSIGSYAFARDVNLSSITISNNVTSIGDFAFMKCSGLSTITIPNSVTSIGDYSFYYSGITSIMIPNNVTTIGDHAFEGCTNLTSVTIPGSVRNIEALTFYECSGLTSITISNGVTSIGQSAFYGCSRLNSIIIPSSVTSIDDYAFGACSNLISIKVSDDNIRYDSRNNCNAIIETSTNTIITACKNTVIPNDVISIGNHAFVGCKSLFSINIPNSVTSIGMQAFYDCSSLISITIPNSVTTIGGGAFVNCSSLNSINIPNSVTSIGNYAFSNCSNLATVISEIQNPFGIEDFVFNNISTQAVLQVPYRTKSKYEVLSGWTKNFKEIVEASGDDSFSVNGVNYSVVSYNDYTVCVSQGSYGMVLEVPAKISYQNAEWTVTGIDNGALANNPDLAAIIWNPSVNFTVSVDNPNLLLYVKSASYAPSSIKNVVVNGSANSITLTDENSGNNFFCPQEFTAKTISYIHIYTMNTGMGEARGWETIALPFDVQKITHSSKGEIVPFVNRKSGDSKKPFWLMEMSGGGFIDANAIKANTPYIISMPNNAHYKNEFRLNGIVTFSAEDVKVKKSDLLSYGYFGNNTFIPNYINQKLTDALVLNVNNNYVSYNGNEAEGSHFVKNLRSLHPFEAYMTTASGARSIAIQDDMTTGIRDIIDMIDEQKNIKVFNLKGQLMKTLEGKTMDEVKRQLPSGVYIVNGKKLIIK